MDKLIKTKDGNWQITKQDTKVPVAKPVLKLSTNNQALNIKNQNIEAIIAGVNLPELSNKLRQRLRDGINLYHRGVRGKIDTYSFLERPVDEGGVGLPTNTVEAIMDKIIPSAKTSDKPQFAPRKKENKHIQDYTDAITTKKSIKNETVANKTEIKNTPPVKRNRLVTDVKSYPKVVGPIEELRILTLKDFRRFDANPDKALVVIGQKLQLLKDDSYEDYIKGVGAWRQSPMYQSYIKLIEDGLHSGKQLSEVVAEARQRNLESLSWNEFIALRNFNSSL